jgi:hypothetical protein
MPYCLECFSLAPILIRVVFAIVRPLQRPSSMASKLVELAPTFTDALFFMENCNTKGRLIILGHMLSSIETHFDDSVAFAAISHQEIDDLEYFNR